MNDNLVFSIYLASEEDNYLRRLYQIALKQFSVDETPDIMVPSTVGKRSHQLSPVQLEVKQVLFCTQDIFDFTSASKVENEIFSAYLIDSWIPGEVSYGVFAVVFKNEVDALAFKLMVS